MRLRQDRAPRPDAALQALPEGADEAGRDAELGRIFRTMRATMNVSRDAIARRLAVAVATIDTFEAGAVAAFPHGRETERIVRGYCELLRVDPQPILWRIGACLRALAAPAPPVSASAWPPPAARPAAARVRNDAAARRWPPGEWVSRRIAGWRNGANAGQGRARGRGRRRRGTLVALCLPLTIAGAMLLAIAAAPAAFYRGVPLLPWRLQGPARTGVDRLLLLIAPRRDGLRWVDVGDPRLRKADKLETLAR
jgi:hypothetical protein